MAENTILIAGASGLIGRAAIEHFAGQKDWRVIALSRRAPEVAVTVEHLAVDRFGGAPERQTATLALDIFDTFYGRNGWKGVGQAKAVIFFLLVAGIAFIQLRLTRSKEVES